jgi:hypothetical protein
MHFDFSTNPKSYSYRNLNYQYYYPSPPYSSVAASIAPDTSNSLAFQGKFVGNVIKDKTVFEGASFPSWKFTSDSPVIDEYHSDGREGECGYIQSALLPLNNGRASSSGEAFTLTNGFTGFDTSQS